MDYWLSVSALTRVIYVKSISEVETYCEMLDRVLRYVVVTSFKAGFQTDIIKPKLHLLMHLPYYVKRFGPPWLFTTEGFESFNKIIREEINSGNQGRGFLSP